MYRAFFCVGSLAMLVASCGQPSSARRPLDGCYYAKGKPVFKIVGSEGRVLIPGDVQTFKVKRGSSASVTFEPGLLFDGSDENHRSVRAFADAPPNSIRVGAPVPTIQMHWVAYGDEDVYLGKPC
jgi:hypothetical protein